MNTNEPVAWQHKVAENWVTTTKDGDDDEWIPLYTHPVYLTDEEILSCWFEHGQMLTIQQAKIQFARAILRKAQEK